METRVDGDEEGACRAEGCRRQPHWPPPSQVRAVAEGAAAVGRPSRRGILSTACAALWALVAVVVAVVIIGEIIEGLG